MLLLHAASLAVEEVQGAEGVPATSHLGPVGRGGQVTMGRRNVEGDAARFMPAGRSEGGNKRRERGGVCRRTEETQLMRRVGC